jgi:hypothetical protein
VLVAGACALFGQSRFAPAGTAGAAPVHQCGDGVDNDGDGLTDYPADPGCGSVNDNSEADGTTQCSDGIDNDGDTLTDYPADPGCTSASDNDETDPPPPPPPAQCADGLDNDGDGKIDYPADPGCSSASDNDEFNAPLAQCADGLDNDADGLPDYPADPGCSSASDNDEFNAPLAQCGDGKDNDSDGLIDYPADPGCTSKTDTDETNAPPAPGASTTPTPAPSSGVLDITTSSPTASAPGLLTPFPVIRIRGTYSRRGVAIQILTVRAPLGARVRARCSGRGCPRHSQSLSLTHSPLRLHRFERRLRAGSVLEVFVSKPGAIGKYLRFRIRAGHAPTRTDLCLNADGRHPMKCPTS